MAHLQELQQQKTRLIITTSKASSITVDSKGYNKSRRSRRDKGSHDDDVDFNSRCSHKGVASHTCFALSLVSRASCAACASTSRRSLARRSSSWRKCSCRNPARDSLSRRSLRRRWAAEAEHRSPAVALELDLSCGEKEEGSQVVAKSSLQIHTFFCPHFQAQIMMTWF